MIPGEVRQGLEEELSRALERAGASRAAIESVMGSGCRLDGVGAAAVEPQLAEASSRLNDRIRALAAALDRLDRGEYGRCAACGTTIARERLAVLPATTLCRACAADR